MHPNLSINNSSKVQRGILEKKYKDIIEINPLLSRRLVSFQASRKMPFYRWYVYREGFSSDMVKMMIKEYPRKSGVVLDPFAGSGTTLFTAREMGFDSFGIELLPIGEFVFRSILSTEKIDSSTLLNCIRQLRSLDFSTLPIDKIKTFKHIPITEKAFPPATEYKLNAFLNYIDDIRDPSELQQTLKFACFCILEKISYTSKDGQFLRWDQNAGKGRDKYTKTKVYSFEEALFHQLNQIAEDIRNRELFEYSANKIKASMTLKTGSSLEILPTLPDESFDLVITSPPYCNRYDYTRTYALDLVYLGANDEEIKELRQRMLSCTVENKEKTELIKTIYSKNNKLDTFYECEKIFNSTNALQEVLIILDRYRREKFLNNPAIYRMVKNYFYEHAFIIFELARLLKNGGKIYYVNDNVRYAGETIPVDLILSEFAEKNGLHVKKISILKKTKGNSSQQMGLFGKETLRKCVYYWEK